MSWYDFLYKPAASAAKKATAESQDTTSQRANLKAQGDAASQFAGLGEANYHALGQDAMAQRQRLLDRANGRNSLSAEQLRQGLQQLYGQQMSMAASAAPRDQAMAARSAMMNAGRIGSGMSGAAATAGIQERNAAMDQLTQAILQQRQQDLQAALQSRNNAVGGYSGQPAGKSDLERYLPLVNAGIGAMGAV